MSEPSDSQSEDGNETPLEQTVSGAVIALIFIVGFGLMFAGVPWFWVVFPVGFAGLLPAAIGLARRYERDKSASAGKTEQEEALDELRARYARGELTDEEFENRVERLLETESVEDAETFLGSESRSARDSEVTETSVDADQPRETSVDPDRSRETDVE